LAAGLEGTSPLLEDDDCLLAGRGKGRRATGGKRDAMGGQFSRAAVAPALQHMKTFATRFTKQRFG
jgi:hypothetical protein